MPERFYHMANGAPQPGPSLPLPLPLKGNRLSRFASFGAMHQHRASKASLTRHHSASNSEQPFSDPETFHQPPSLKGQPTQPSPRPVPAARRRAGVAGVESLSGFNRFSRMLKSLRVSRTNSPENMSPGSSESGLSSPGPPSDPVIPAHSAAFLAPTQHRLHRPDLLLWRKRSRGSLRRHNVSPTHLPCFVPSRLHSLCLRSQSPWRMMLLSPPYFPFPPSLSSLQRRGFSRGAPPFSAPLPARPPLPGLGFPSIQLDATLPGQPAILRTPPTHLPFHLPHILLCFKRY